MYVIRSQHSSLPHGNFYLTNKYNKWKELFFFKKKGKNKVCGFHATVDWYFNMCILLVRSQTLNIERVFGSSHCGITGSAVSWECWDLGVIPSPAQWVKNPVLLQLRLSSQLQLQSDPWLSSSMCQGAEKKKKKLKVFNLLVFFTLIWEILFFPNLGNSERTFWKKKDDWWWYSFNIHSHAIILSFSSFFFFFRFSFLAIQQHMEFLGQGSDPSHTCDLHCSCGNARSLTDHKKRKV